MDIEIKQGDYGISYAIKRQLNAEGVNTKNINSCWTKIMQAFQGDDKSEVNNKTIGEQWTTLRTNISVTVGQIIKIADETWNKIKKIVSEAVGQNGNNNTEEAKRKQEKKEVDKKTANKPSEKNSLTDADYRTTDCPGIYYCEKTKKHYKKVDGKMVEIKPQYKNGRITQYFKDGSHTERINEKKNEYIIVKFDKNNELIMRTEYRNGKPYKTSSNNDKEHGFYQKDRYHEEGKNRINLYQKALPNGDIILYQRDDRDGYTGYQRFDSNLKFLYNCDKDGNRIK